jgi:hypothetical protein
MRGVIGECGLRRPYANKRVQPLFFEERNFRKRLAQIDDLVTANLCRGLCVMLLRHVGFRSVSCRS